MRAAHTDQRFICPDAHSWQLFNGAYLDWDEIVLPQLLSSAHLYVHVAGAVHKMTWTLPVFVPPGGTDRTFRAIGYYGPDRENRVTPTQSVTGNAPVYLTGQWASYHLTLAPGPKVHWLLLIVGGNTQFQTPGMRVKPGPPDWAINQP